MPHRETTSTPNNLTNLIFLTLSLGHVILASCCSECTVEVTVKARKTPFSNIPFMGVGVGLDSSLIREKWKALNFTSCKLLTLTRALAPTYMRLGGTSADLVLFNALQRQTEDHNIDETSGVGDFRYEDFMHPKIENFTMTGSQWDQILTFVSKTDMELIFDVNVMLRDYDEEKSSWKAQNFESLLAYTVEKNITHDISFELGNEPLAYKHLFNISISGRQLAEDFKKLRSALKSKESWSRWFGKSLILGPSMERPALKASMPYLKEFLGECDGCVNAISWHHYYGSGKVMTVSDFVNISTLDSLLPQVNAVKEVVAKSSMHSAPIWLGETSSSYGGGAKDISDRYVAGFLWLDKLGISARTGVQLVIRQALYGGYYSLLDENVEPTPDYWLTVLYKTLVGGTVLDTSSNDTLFRVYAHCTSSRANYKPGAITVYFLNLNPHDVQVVLPFDKDLFLLTSGGNLQSKHVHLNGKRLILISDKELPAFTPVSLKEKQDFHVQAYSFGFVVLPQAHAAVCK